jgi:hypothetical protein
MPAEVRIQSKDQGRLKSLSRAMKAEEGGALLRKDLIVGLRAAVQPGQAAVKEQLRAWPHGGATVASPALGSFLASKTTTQVRLSGRRTGVAVRVARTPNLRGFRKAGAALNSAAGWRHKVFGRDVWVQQTSPQPGFFDKTLLRGKSACRAAVLKAVKSMERRVAK